MRAGEGASPLWTPHHQSAYWGTPEDEDINALYPPTRPQGVMFEGHPQSPGRRGCAPSALPFSDPGRRRGFAPLYTPLSIRLLKEDLGDHVVVDKDHLPRWGNCLVPTCLAETPKIFKSPSASVWSYDPCASMEESSV